MPLIISVPLKQAVGMLDRGSKSFTPQGSGGLTLLGINIDWPPNKPSGRVTFSFTLEKGSGSFPAGQYDFVGHIKDGGNSCENPFAIACGTVLWPGSGDDEPGWEATGGPLPKTKSKKTKKSPATTRKPSRK
jgi:hypothetical protein